MIGFDDALERIVGSAQPVGRETTRLDAAQGRFLAAPVIARMDSPPANVSAMDGYAVREADLPELNVVGVSYPGSGYDGALGVGECVRIFTGAPVPAGADRVIVQEIVRAEGGRALIEGQVGAGRHIRPRASDFAAGDALLPTGRRLDARALVAAAGADVESVETCRPPRIVVVGTGDELREPGSARQSPGAIPDSVSLGIAALVAERGGLCLRRERVPDDPERLEEAAARALDDADLVVITGGASVGEKDHAKRVFAALGLELVFSKVAIKPGKPVWYGSARGKRVMGLPGNPTSALVTGRLLLAPLVRGMAGGDARAALRWRLAPLAAPLAACGDRETFVRGRWSGETVEPLRDQDSGAQRALARAELLIRRWPGSPEAASGERVEVIDF